MVALTLAIICFVVDGEGFSENPGKYVIWPKERFQYQQLVALIKTGAFFKRSPLYYPIYIKSLGQVLVSNNIKVKGYQSLAS